MKRGCAVTPKTYHYTSLWRKVDADHFRLIGTLAARPGERGIYFPNDRESQREWDRHRSLWKGEGSEGDLEWLNAVASSGNGIIEEFDEVRRIKAPSLQDALQQSYVRTAEDRGELIELFEPVAAGEFISKGDPFAALFPVSSRGKEFEQASGSPRKSSEGPLVSTEGTNWETDDEVDWMAEAEHGVDLRPVEDDDEVEFVHEYTAYA